MLNLVVTLLIIALIAAVLGFGGIASASVEIAKIIFFVAIVWSSWGKTPAGVAKDPKEPVIPRRREAKVHGRAPPEWRSTSPNHEITRGAELNAGAAGTRRHLRRFGWTG